MVTNFNPSNPKHMVTSINLSGFAARQFSKTGFKQLLESIIDMRCLHCLILSGNGIDDNYTDEIDALLKIPKITKLDLSSNYIGKKGGQLIAKLMKESIEHLEWIDLSRNSFGNDIPTTVQIVQGLKKQTNLYHFCLDSNVLNKDASAYQGVEAIAKLLKELPQLNSAGIIDSKISAQAMRSIETAITS